MSYARPRLVISTVGISLITAKLDPTVRALVNRNTNIVRLQPLPIDVREALDAGKMLTRTNLQKHEYGVAAELSSLAAIFGWQTGHPPRIPSTDELYLITTDTHVGHACVDALQEYFDDHGIAVQRIACNGLQTADPGELQIALADLTKQLSDIVELYRDSHEVICNVTAGFKAISAYIQQTATLLRATTCYLFEQSKSLIYIPKMPITLDIQLFIDNPKYFVVMRQIWLNIEVTDITGADELLDRAGIFFIDKAIVGGYAFSAWGVVVWQEIRQRFYSQRLYAPPTTKIVFAEEKQLIKNIEKIDVKRFADVNESIDCLAQWCLNHTMPVKSHTIKQIYGPVADYEIYAWNDGSSGRLFFNKKTDGSIEVLSRLDHLK
jgi:putative CRISPR-associated protein (TIGR02619 family)